MQMRNESTSEVAKDGYNPYSLTKDTKHSDWYFKEGIPQNVHVTREDGRIFFANGVRFTISCDTFHEHTNPSCYTGPLFSGVFHIIGDVKEGKAKIYPEPINFRYIGQDEAVKRGQA